MGEDFERLSMNVRVWGTAHVDCRILTIIVQRKSITWRAQKFHLAVCRKWLMRITGVRSEEGKCIWNAGEEDSNQKKKREILAGRRKTL